MVEHGSYLAVALHQHNITNDEGLHVAAGVDQLGRADGAGRTVHWLKKEQDRTQKAENYTTVSFLSLIQVSSKLLLLFLFVFLFYLLPYYITFFISCGCLTWKEAVLENPESL